ncbi:CO dehydrogenase iron-sulfur protein CooF [Methanosarcina horonobensis HB-1 = JCM 15518]|uniref:CO dehydrogenase iron-sulfur protein CooF n=1 Tax=Methanosarcina horonobensis HB-1 = JCM 15518 TaxID=1434110 RepID=A0A0E3WUK0_9EURY|nr:4Fe-4S dicluster domain-containing protein [Methanosarcina horonobensis]AKB78980.1 CO dehydrogenase iron-sulfur protein CooF [Methanosarcina horonobensis HB-1 = JCM 15518]
MKDVIIRPELCMGCRSCEVACAVSHSKSKNLFSALGEDPAPKKRISVEYMPAIEASVPITCRHCEDAPCVSVCPTKALSKDTATGTVNHNLERCVDCWTCSMVCTRFSSLYQLILASGCWTSSMANNYGVIDRRTEEGTVVRCDLCEGRELPACVEACPTHALVFFEVERRQEANSFSFS